MLGLGTLVPVNNIGSRMRLLEKGNNPLPIRYGSESAVSSPMGSGFSHIFGTHDGHSLYFAVAILWKCICYIYECAVSETMLTENQRC